MFFIKVSFIFNSVQLSISLSQIKQQKPQRQQPNAQHNHHNPHDSLPFPIPNRGLNRTNCQPSQKPSQMSHIVYVVRVWCKNENKHNDYNCDKYQLTFEQSTDDVQAFPVYDDVGDDSADYAIEAG